jgi:dTDP-4-dehydrorhamnose reductase
MKVLVTGADGQLGHELKRSCPQTISLIETDRETLDITDATAIASALAEHAPDWLINCAAYTAVDKAESDQDAATTINATAAGLLANACATHSARMVQISTDFVFDGLQSTPYAPGDRPKPLSVYGATKLAGEQAVSEALPDALIIRTSWLYSAHGSNFVKSMLNLMQSRDELGIVYDQVGSPTWAGTLARALWQLIAVGARGIHHCSDNGVASWYDFAVAIQEEALATGMLQKEIPVRPIRTRQYPTPARRPAYSVLDKQLTESQIGVMFPHWRKSMRLMLEELFIIKGKTHHSDIPL